MAARCCNVGKGERCSLPEVARRLRLDEGDVQRLTDAGIALRFAAGETIYMEGDPCRGLYCIASGRVVTRKIDFEGNSVLIRLSEVGDTLGHRALLAGEVHGTATQALTPVALCLVPRPVAERLLAHSPELALALARRMAADLRAAEDRFLRTAVHCVRDRLAHLLLELAREQAAGTPHGVRIVELPVSRQDLAAMVGIRPETLARTIRAMEQEGLAAFHGRQVVILRPLLPDKELR